MTNKEKYTKEILDIICNGNFIAIVKNKPYICDEDINCSECDLNNDYHDCQQRFAEWCNKEYQEVDWSNVKVDTPILVKTKESENWKRRYFAAYKDGRVYAWDSGATSWSATNKVSWGYKYAKLIDRPEYIDALPTHSPVPKLK